MHSFPFCFDPLRLFFSNESELQRGKGATWDKQFVCLLLSLVSWLVGCLCSQMAERRKRLAFTHATHMHTRQEQETYQRKP